MIDIHSHILPGIDDGSPDMESSIKMVAIAASEGIHTMLATPHFIPGDKEIDRDQVLEKVSELNQYIRQNTDLDMTIYPGEEVFLSPDIPELYSQGKLVTLFDEGKYLLIELPMMSIPSYTKEVIYSLNTKGVKPIIAHPERNQVIARNVDKLSELVSMGALVQVNSLSFYGVFGSNAKKTAEKIVRKGLAQFIATDCHTPRARSPRFQKLYKKFSPRLIDIMMRQNPEKLMTGREIEVSPEGYKKAAKMNIFRKIAFYFGY